MVFRVDVYKKDKVFQKENLTRQIRNLGIRRDTEISIKKIYFFEANLSNRDLDLICERFLIDPILESYTLSEGFFPIPPSPQEIIIAYNPGVCDTVALSLKKVIRDISLKVKNIRTGRYYKFSGLTSQEIKFLASKLLYNSLIEHILDYNKLRNRSEEHTSELQSH